MRVRNLLFWASATLLLAAIVHLSVVLFAPMVDVGKRIAQFETAASPNTLQLISNETDRGRLMVEPSPDISYAFCRFDIAARPLMINAPIPESYWSVSIYSDTGENLYTINDAQTGARQLQLMVAREGDVSARQGSELSGGEILDVPAETIIFPSPVSTGLVIIRGFIPDRSLKEHIDQMVGSANCAPLQAL